MIVPERMKPHLSEGYFAFCASLKKMEERGDDLGAARALSEQEDVVRIMTIHKSKGLEFPVVIVGGMDRQFNVQDLNKKYLLDKTYGLASKYRSEERRVGIGERIQSLR